MGVDTRIFLPDNVRLRDVCDVVGVAVGFQPYKRRAGSRQWPDGFYATQDGCKAEATSVMEMPYIRFDDRHTSFHFEPDNRRGRLLMPKSTAFWAMVGHRLVDFFGGMVDYNDCDSVDVDYKRRNKGDAKNAPTDGQPYFDFQQRIMDVKPITKQELEDFDGNVAYPFDSDGNEYNFDEQGRMIRGPWRSAEQLEEIYRRR